MVLPTVLEVAGMGGQCPLLPTLASFLCSQLLCLSLLAFSLLCLCSPEAPPTRSGAPGVGMLQNLLESPGISIPTCGSPCLSSERLRCRPWAQVPRPSGEGASSPRPGSPTALPERGLLNPWLWGRSVGEGGRSGRQPRGERKVEAGPAWPLVREARLQPGATLQLPFRSDRASPAPAAVLCGQCPELGAGRCASLGSDPRPWPESSSRSFRRCPSLKSVQAWCRQWIKDNSVAVEKLSKDFIFPFGIAGGYVLSPFSCPCHDSSLAHAHTV